MFTIKELKKIIEENNLPDDMQIGLVDISTDEPEDMNYDLTNKNFLIEDYYSELVDESSSDYNKPKGKMLFISFVNKLNENPL